LKALVTGCAGFIGSNLVDRLLDCGHTVAGIDNLATGRMMFLEENALASPQFRFFEGDTLNLDMLRSLMEGVDIVFHLAANADVRFGPEHPRKDLEQNTIATWNVLEAMRLTGVRRIVFASTGSVYGEAAVIPTPEDCPFPVQTSLYGASKLAAEGLIESYAEGFGIHAYIFRFVSILGERYTHGHVFDFYRQLLAHPRRLEVLGNGKQRKSYLYVGDCVAAILTAVEKSTAKVNIFNLGSDEYVAVDDSVAAICEYLGLKPAISHSGGDRGWIGDNPFIWLDCARIRATGWRPTLSIREGIIRTLQYLEKHPRLLERS
jgi:UDP-glucose 4-epimerase